MPFDDPTAPEKRGVISCSVCGEPMASGNTKTDEAGQLIRDECYLCKLRKDQRRP
jgi:hypothetical protein